MATLRYMDKLRTQYYFERMGVGQSATTLSAIRIGAGLLVSDLLGAQSKSQWKTDEELITNDLKSIRSIWDKAVDFVMKRDDVAKSVQTILAQLQAEINECPVQNYFESAAKVIAPGQPVVQRQVKSGEDDDQSTVRVARQRG